eukprot:TRINITY_DN46818_c0_g1_i1.p1 TRINITY_DN46818_c0_g1~~TRINITY_DN46818_c0_g1_i1.p1  ORF type:complete len:460 (+),score=77.67 TRINITY_DN46818_c0_g1_i1:21-1400(+)
MPGGKTKAKGGSSGPPAKKQKKDPETDKEKEKEEPPPNPSEILKDLEESEVRIYGEERLTADVATVIKDVVDNCPTLMRASPSNLAVRMRGRVRKWIRSLGRTPDEEGIKITMAHADGLGALDDGKAYPIESSTFSAEASKTFELKGSEIKDLASKAIVTYAPEYLNEDEVFAGNLKDDKVHTNTQMIAISGPVYAMFDHEMRPHERAPRPFIACSIPGINFAYSTADQAKFTTEMWNDERTKKKKVVDNAAALLRMKEIYAHALLVFQKFEVKFPCLCAIGCGAFKGEFNTVPHLWAEALYDVLATFEYDFGCVFVSLPNFGEQENFNIFCDVFNKQTKTGDEENKDTSSSSSSGAKKKDDVKMPKTAVCFLETKSMISLADYLSRKDKAVGVLNPSDVQAIKQGYLGMFWDGGHVALEEIIAMQTTLLLQHRGLNPALYDNTDRRMQMSIKIPAVKK